MNNFLIKTVVFFLFLFSINISLARDISIVTTHWSPHVGGDLAGDGPLGVITKEAFRRGGHNATIEFLPWKRALKQVEEGRKDAVIAAYSTDERRATYLFSDEVYRVDVGLVALKSSDIKSYNTLEDLKPYHIGVSRGYANAPEFDAADFLKKDVARSVNLNIKKLFLNRLDMIVGEFDVIRHEMKLEDLCVCDVEFVDPPLDSQGLYTMISRLIDDGPEITRDFNRGLAEMKAEGRIDEILRNYLNRE